jgi:hypothetical protein
VQRYLKAALIGGGIGFGIGAAYAVFFVAYRDSIAAQRAAAEQAAGVTPGTVGAESAESPVELPARARIAEAMKERTARAKVIREAEPSLSWPEAMRRAAGNGTPAPEPVQEEQHGE